MENCIICANPTQSMCLDCLQIVCKKCKDGQLFCKKCYEPNISAINTKNYIARAKPVLDFLANRLTLPDRSILKALIEYYETGDMNNYKAFLELLEAKLTPDAIDIMNQIKAIIQGKIHFIDVDKFDSKIVVYKQYNRGFSLRR